MSKEYREGALGAIIDEYERVIDEMKNIILNIQQQDYITIVDNKTDEPDFRSIQTITNHVVRSGYGYANLIRRSFNEPWIEKKETYDIDTPQYACDELNNMLEYTVETLQNKWNLPDSVLLKEIIKTKAGQCYDMEQLLEHAIVHVLRHRRQIEKYLSR
jgi:uncharacterized damage-inducible protein DinB